MEKTIVVTSLPQAETAYFGESTVAAAREIKAARENGSCDEQAKKSVLDSINKSYADCKPRLKQLIGEQLAELRQTHLAKKQELEKELAEKLAVIDGEYAALSVEERSTKERQCAYKDAVNGEKTITQRALIRLNDEYDREVTEIKSQEALLASAKGELTVAVTGSKFNVANTAHVSALNFKASFNPKRTVKDKSFWLNMLPFIMLAVIIVAHLIACSVTGYKFNLDTIITYGIYVAIVAIGGVFIYSQGAFDMSLGPASLMCAAIAGLSYNASGSIVVAFIMAVILGVCLGLINAFLANCLKLPVMVMTLTMMSILSSTYSTIAETQTGGYIVVTGISDYNSTALKWIVLVVFAVLCYVLFNYTKIGRRNKLIGSNDTCAKFTGISIMKAGLISFAISGIGLGLCGFLFTVQNSYVNSGTALDTIGLNVIIAISIGGMPTSGGPRSRISAAIVGAFFIIFLEQFFAALGLENYKYLAKGLIFLAVAFINFYGMRTKRLAQ